MSENQTVSLEEITHTLGFDPYAISESVYACAVIEKGKRKGYWCVFTSSTKVQPLFAQYPNFADASWGSFGEDRQAAGMVYIFSPAHCSQLQTQKAG